MKRNPPPSEVFRDPEIRITDHEFGTFKIVGKDEIKRELKGKWRIVLNKSSRDGGNIKKQQWYICTVNYWNVVDNKYKKHEENLSLTLFNFGAFGRISRHFPNIDSNEKRILYSMMVPGSLSQFN